MITRLLWGVSIVHMNKKIRMGTMMPITIPMLSPPRYVEDVGKPALNSAYAFALVNSMCYNTLLGCNLVPLAI